MAEARRENHTGTRRLPPQVDSHARGGIRKPRGLRRLDFRAIERLLLRAIDIVRADFRRCRAPFASCRLPSRFGAAVCSFLFYTCGLRKRTSRINRGLFAFRQDHRAESSPSKSRSTRPCPVRLRCCSPLSRAFATRARRPKAPHHRLFEVEDVAIDGSVSDLFLLMDLRESPGLNASIILFIYMARWGCARSCWPDEPEGEPLSRLAPNPRPSPTRSRFRTAPSERQDPDFGGSRTRIFPRRLSAQTEGQV